MSGIPDQIGLIASETRATIQSGITAGIDEKGVRHYPVYEILDEVPEVMDRPIRLIGGQAYGATWLPVLKQADGNAELTS